jgi:hypothetical protein
MLNISKTNPFLCREALEESTFAGHFWELRSSVFNVVSFVEFLRFGRTRTYQFVILFELL